MEVGRTPHAPAPPPTAKHERVVDYEKNSEGAPHASARPAENHERVLDCKQTSEDEPAPRPAANREIVIDCEQNSEDAPRASSIAKRILRTLSTRQRHQRPKATRGSSLSRVRKTMQDAPRASAGTRRKQREFLPSQSTSKIRTAPQQQRFDAHETRRGFAGRRGDSRGATTRTTRHAGSPQRSRRRALKFARRHNESDSTCTIPA